MHKKSETNIRLSTSNWVAWRRFVSVIYKLAVMLSPMKTVGNNRDYKHLKMG